MAIRPTKDIIARPPKEREPEEAMPETFSQRKRPETGRYSLRVDRQPKQSFAQLADAEAAGIALKKKFPVVQVVVYDTVDLVGKTIEAA